MYLPLLYCIEAVVCRLYEMLYPCICNVVISCWKSGAYGYVICRGGTDMCFVPGSGWKHLDLEQYRISGLTLDLLSLFPQKGARIIGGEESKQAQRGQHWGEELAQNRWGQRKKKTSFYSPPRIQPLGTVDSPPTTVLPLGERYYRSGCGTTALP